VIFFHTYQALQESKVLSSDTICCQVTVISEFSSSLLAKMATDFTKNIRERTNSSENVFDPLLTCQQVKLHLQGVVIQALIAAVRCALKQMDEIWSISKYGICDLKLRYFCQQGPNYMLISHDTQATCCTEEKKCCPSSDCCTAKVDYNCQGGTECCSQANCCEQGKCIGCACCGKEAACCQAICWYLPCS